MAEGESWKVEGLTKARAPKISPKNGLTAKINSGGTTAPIALSL